MDSEIKQSRQQKITTVMLGSFQFGCSLDSCQAPPVIWAAAADFVTEEGGQRPQTPFHHGTRVKPPYKGRAYLILETN
jgi:hypothetical protein